MGTKNGKNFEDSLLMIEDALKWAERQDTSRLSEFFIENANVPLYTFASGGNFSAMDYCAMMYETNKAIAKPLTPLMMASLSDDTLRNAKILIYIGEGKGPDEEYMVKRAARVNPDGVCGVTRNNFAKNILVDTLKSVTDNWFVYNIPSQRAFIATVSTIAEYGLFYKAFTNDNSFTNKLIINLNPDACFKYAPRVEGYEIPELSQIKNFIVLYSGWSKPVAYDFESKMVECGIANVQLADYRNFCHGRFIFLSNHFEESAFVLFLTPREIAFAKKLILEGENHQREDLFPPQTAIITISTELDEPLASIDLLIKMQVCFNEIAKVNDVEPNNPNNPYSIDKRVPRNKAFEKLDEMGALKSCSPNASNGSLNNVSKKVPINYNPKKSVEKLAESNNVSVAKIRKYIAEHKIDRNYDEKMCLYNSIRLTYMDDSECSISSIAKKLKLSINTVKQYIKIEKPQFELAEGKICMTYEEPILEKIRDSIKAAESRFPRVKQIQKNHPEYNALTIMKKMSLTNDKKGYNRYQIECFMQMDELKYKLKNRELVFDVKQESKSDTNNVYMNNRIIGAIIGDIVGSTYEFVDKIPKKFKLFRSGCTFTDDSVLTIAIADALLHNRPFADTIWEWGSKYTNAGFGRSFKEWKKRRKIDANATNNSKGNGCGMRVSPVGYWAKSIEEVMELAKETAIITHNSEEGIIGAQAIASATFMAKQKVTKDDIKKFIEETFNYNLDMTYDEIWKQVNEYDNENKLRREREWAENTCPVAIIAFLNSSDYESAIRTAISYGGDVDTIACMTGGIAAAYYGVPDEIIEMAASYLPQDIINIVNEFDGLELKNKNTPPQLDRWFKKEHILVYGSGKEIVSHTKSGSPIRDNESTGYIANRYFGSKQQLEGLSGCSYAIPTVGATLPDIKHGIKRFIDFVNDNPDLTFLITDIACSKKSGYTPQEVAPMFKDIADFPNVYLPKEFREVIS